MYTFLLLAAACVAQETPADPPAVDGPVAVPTAAPSPAKEAPPMTIKLNLPYHPWQGAWDTVRADPAMGPHVDPMIRALEASGPPEGRLRALTEAVGAARSAFAASGNRNTRVNDALAMVEVDLRVAFFNDLAKALAGSSAPAPERRAQLQALRALVDADPPLGVPAPHPHRPWSTFARQTAALAVDTALEQVGG